MKKHRPTIKQLEDFAFLLHSKGLEWCMHSHKQIGSGGPTFESLESRGHALGFKDASAMLRDMIDPPKKELGK